MSRRVRRRDSRGALELVPFQADDLETRFPMVTRDACERELHVIDEHGRVHRGARAAAEVARRLGLGWRIAGSAIAYPPLLWLAMLGYRWIARNRHRFGPDTCEIGS